MGGVNARAREVLARTADLAPELVLVWAPHVPKGDFAARVRSVVRGSVVEAVEASTPLAALEEARVWFTLVGACAAHQDEATPATLSEVARSTAKESAPPSWCTGHEGRAKVALEPKAIWHIHLDQTRAASTRGQSRDRTRRRPYPGNLGFRRHHAGGPRQARWLVQGRLARRDPMDRDLVFGLINRWNPRFSARVYWSVSQRNANWLLATSVRISRAATSSRSVRSRARRSSPLSVKRSRR